MNRAAYRAWTRPLSMDLAAAIRLSFAVALAAVVLTFAPAWAQTVDPVVAKVDGVEVRESEVALAEEDLGSNIPPQVRGDARRDFIVSYLTDIMLVAKAAEAAKAAEGKDFQTRLKFIRNRLLMEQILQVEGKKAVTEQAMREVYDSALKQMSGEEEDMWRRMRARSGR